MINAFTYAKAAFAVLPLLAAGCAAGTGAYPTEAPLEGSDASDLDAEPPLDAEDDVELDAAEHEADGSVEDGGTPYDAATLEDASDASDGGEDDLNFPLLLSQTGLYRDIAPETLAPDVTIFEPRYALWSDAAVKRRFLKLPPNTQIDTSDMDAWVFPVGTKAFKEFRSGGVRVETRMLHKVSSKHWVMVAYRWRADQKDADALPEGQEDSLGTTHDIPSQALCTSCHDSSQDAVLGVSALQMSHEREGENLTRLAKAGALSHPPKVQGFTIPGGPIVEQALGYLHANCGHCHREGTATQQRLLKRSPYTGGPLLWESTEALQVMEHTLGYQTTVDRPNGVLPDLPIVAPGAPDRSELFIRIGQRGRTSLQMPPLGTDVVDEQGLKVIRAWIESLKPSH